MLWKKRTPFINAFNLTKIYCKSLEKPISQILHFLFNIQFSILESLREKSLKIDEKKVVKLSSQQLATFHQISKKLKQ